MRAGVLLVTVAALLTLCVSGAQAAPGDLDPSFGTNGITQSNFGSDDIAYSVVVRKDGKIIVGGDANDGADFALTKNDAKGIEHSQKIFDLGGSDEEIRALATDGKNATYAAGWTNAGGNYDFALVKYTKGLDLVKSFGINGIATTDFAGGRDQGRAIALQDDGKIVVAGVANWPSGDVALARYTKDGQPDPDFGTGGKVVLDLSGTAATTTRSPSSSRTAVTSSRQGAPTTPPRARSTGSSPASPQGRARHRLRRRRQAVHQRHLRQLG